MKHKLSTKESSWLKSITDHIGQLAVGAQQQITTLLAPEKTAIVSIFDHYDIIQKSDKHLQFIPTQHKTWLGAYIFQAYIEGGLTSENLAATIHKLHPDNLVSHDTFMLALYDELGDSLIDYIQEYQEAKHITKREE